MDYYISRNYKKRLELERKAEKIKKIRDEELDKKAQECEDLPDSEWFAIVDEAFAKYDVLGIKQKIRALEYPECRNEWFKKFVTSFGICEHLRITRKQGEIFRKYSEANHERTTSARGINYYVRVGNLFVETTLFSEREPAFVTISEMVND